MSQHRPPCRKKINPLYHVPASSRRATEQQQADRATAALIRTARRTGRLNLSNRELVVVPDAIFGMFEIRMDITTATQQPADDDDDDTTTTSWWIFEPLTLLDLSSNRLVRLPAAVKLFADLAVLNLQQNNLATLPEEIGMLSKLARVNLSHNKLNSLPVEFFKLSQIVQLNLSHNCFEEIDRKFNELIALQILDLSHNQLINLPESYLANLIELNVSHNQLNELPEDFVCIDTLTKLDLSNNHLKKLDNFEGLIKLEILLAQDNNLEILPICYNLEELYLGNNLIKEITTEFCEASKLLKILDLRDNVIEMLPNEMNLLENLIRLDLTNNELTNLPNTLGLLKRLQKLDVEGNRLRQIRHAVMKSTCQLLQYLRDRIGAKIYAKEESKIYPDKSIMKSSKTLNLSAKELSSVPDEVFERALHADVRTVDLSRNGLNGFPVGLKAVAENLSELNLSGNKIKVIPDEVELFGRLQYLDVGSNLLTDLPASLKELRNLRELVISYNQFPVIPECVFALETLEILLASNNRFVDIDIVGLRRLKTLARLDLSNNNIANVPLELGHLTNLRCLKINGNAFRIPRQSVLEQGTESVMAYLRDRIPK